MMDDDLESDPDYLRAKAEAERNHPLYPMRVAIEEAAIHLRGIGELKAIGYLILVLLALILWRVW